MMVEIIKAPDHPRAALERRPFGVRWTTRSAMVVVALSHGLLFLGLFKIRLHVTGMFYYELGSDTQHVYWPAVQKLLAGHVPYVDPHFFVEYPPLGTAFFLLPALLHPTSLRVYDWLFAAEVLAVDLATLPLIARLARRQQVSARAAVTVYGVLIPLLGSLVTQRYDLVPATLTLGALLALLGERSIMAWVLLLVATLMKLYPAALVPLFLLYEWRSLLGVPTRAYTANVRQRVGGIVLYVGGLIASTVGWYLLAPASLWRFVAWETRRGIEIESLAGSVAEVVHLLGLPAHKVDSYGSYDIASALTPTLKVLSTVVTVGLLALVYLSYARRLARQRGTTGRGETYGRASWIASAYRPTVLTANRKHTEIIDVPDAHGLVIYATLAVLAVLLGSKLLSIQFLLWLVPLLVVQPHRFRPIIALSLGVVLLSQWAYPMHWHDLWSFKAGLIVQVALRNLLLVGLFVTLWRHRGDSWPVSVERGTA